MLAPARQRILQRTAGVLTFTPLDPDGEPSTDPVTVTVGVVNSAGDSIVASGTATVADGVNRTVTLTAANTADLDILTATWTVSGVTVGVTTHEVVGGYYFSVAALRLAEPHLADTSAYPTATLVRHRNEAENSFESWTNYAWVPRFSVVDIPCGGVLPLFAIRSVRWVRNYSDADTYTLLTAGELALIDHTGYPAGVLGGTWYGTRYVAGVEHGADAPPDYLVRRAQRWTRHLAMKQETSLSSAAVSYTTPEGMTVNVGRTGTDWRPTGDEFIDEVLRRPDVDHRLVGIA